ncbi:MAG TPA: hypothetical protein VL899_04530 [Alphaproteobacteria bacterium]|jgi:hypothetical protein|nr:hypothetical protein [Alphaproteobacteria bacterium]
MGKNRALIAIALASACLSACAPKPEIPFDRAAGPPIKTIGVLTPKTPDGAAVILATDVGRSFGLIGALVDAGMRASRETKFKAALASENFSFNDVSSKALKDCLVQAGYAVVDVPVTRSSSGFLKTYPKAADTKVDAYLDTVILGYGYVAAGIGDSTPYRPALQAQVRLVRAADASILMDDTIIYDPIGSPVNAVTISPPESYQFTNFDSLVADPLHAVADLDDAIVQSEQAACRLLR